MGTLFIIIIAVVAADFANWIICLYDITPYQLDRWKKSLDNLESEQNKVINNLKKIRREAESMNKIFFISIIIITILIGCTDWDVNQVSNKTFEVDGIYLRRVVIGGDHIYFITDAEGNPIAGASCTRRFNRITYYATSIVPSDSMK